MIVVKNLSKFYGAHRALSDLSFTIEKNEVVGFLGLNGAGKTTVLKILSGLLLPSAGSFSIAGHDGLEEPREVRRLIGFLPDRPPLYDDMTVRQMVAYAGQLNGMSTDGLQKRVDEVLEQTNLSHRADELVGWLSHGYRQRVGIAQAIVHKPALVILDEPISGLDPVQIMEMRDLVKGLGESHTVLVSSHILAEISQTCDRILVLNQGRIVAKGSERELAKEMRGTRIEVIARGTEEAARGALGELGGVSDLVIEAQPDGVVRIEAEAPDESAREAAVAALVGGGLGVRRVTELRSGLESVFLRLTDVGESPVFDAPKGDGAADAQAQAGGAA